MDSNDEEDVFISNENYWKDSVKELSELEEKSIRKGGSKHQMIDGEMLKDLFLLLE